MEPRGGAGRRLAAAGRAVVDTPAVGEPQHAGPGSGALFERAVGRMPGGNTRSTVFVAPQPPYAVRGEGYTILDADGHSVIDLQANMSALVHGHAHPAITAADRGSRTARTWSPAATRSFAVARPAPRVTVGGRDVTSAFTTAAAAGAGADHRPRAAARTA